MSGLPRDRLSTIILIEADATALSAHSENLYRDGFDVLSAASPKEALALFRTLDPQLLVLDMALPEGRGSEFLRRIRGDDIALNGRVDPKVPVSSPSALSMIRLGASSPTWAPTTISADRSCTATSERASRRCSDFVESSGNSRRASSSETSGSTSRAAARRSVIARSGCPRRSSPLVRLVGFDPTRVFSKEELVGAIWGSRRRGRDPSARLPRHQGEAEARP